MAATDVLEYPFEQPAELAPPVEFAELRAERPIQRVELPYGGQAWLVTRYADVKQVYADPRFSRAATVGEDIPRTTPARVRAGGLLAMDPPEHSRLRKLVASAFTMKNVQRWRPRTEQVVGELIAGMRPPADLVDQFCLPLPVTVICELLGVPATDRHFFQHFAQIMLSTTAATAGEIEQAREELFAYLREHIAARRAQPEGQRSRDLLTDLVEARDNTDRLSEDELVQMGVGILVAGHETTANQLANFTFTLLDTGLWARLVERPELLDSAVEELLRYVQLGNGGSARVATEDVELAGVLVRAGESVIGALGSANRDESVFPGADRIDFDRETNPHVGFGYGVHHCLGAQLARMELRVGLGALIEAFPGLRFAESAEQVPWRVGRLVHGPRELRLRW
ncbi:cytochrome P450 [Sciscionella sediminilitoris]|uniref:cytochrome P450 n=1 Tax=Sciscionella sediminilitoris TaxID=1445613 RepID=UPI0004DED980|nr:cytochrome P450 [Sciscionella sp. SE31]